MPKFLDDIIVDGGAKLGIGTANPDKQLTFVQADDDAIQIRRLTTSEGNAAAGSGISWTWTSSNTDTQTWAAIRAIMPGNSNSHLTFSTRNTGGSFGERLRITDAGNVGIGTATPNGNLQIVGKSGGSGTVLISDVDNGSAANDSLMLQQGATNSYIWNKDSGFISFGANNAERMRLTPSGQLGIGTTTPTDNSRLHIEAGHGTTRARMYYPGSVTTRHAYIDMWASEPGSTYNGSGIGSNILGSPYYGKRTTDQGMTYIRFLDGTFGIWTGTVAQSSASQRFVINQSGVATFTGEVIAASLDISGNADIDGTLNADGLDVDGNADISGNLTGLDNVTSDNYYINDTNTRLHEGSSNSVKITTNSGNLQIGPQNSSWCHMYTDRANFYFNTGITVDTGIVSSYNEDLVLKRSNSSLHKLTIAENVATFTGEVEAASLDINGNADISGNLTQSGNTPVLTLGVINTSTGNAKIQMYSKNTSGNGFAIQYNKNGSGAGEDQLEFIDGSGSANFKFVNGGAATFAGDVTTSGSYFADTHFRSTDGNATLSATGGGGVYLRPDGYNQTSAQVVIAASSGNATFAGDVNLADSKKLQLGASQDLQIYHDGSNTHIVNLTGNLRLRNFADDKDITFESDNGSGGTTPYFFLDGSANLNKFLVSAKYLDSVKALFGDSSDLQIYHNGSNSYVENTTGNLNILSGTGNIEIYNNTNDGDITLSTDNASGGTTAYITLDGSIYRTKFHTSTLHLDGVASRYGNGEDLQIYHDGSNTYMQNATGTFHIDQIVDDGDIQLRCDDGSGGHTAYITLDGSAARTVFSRETQHSDNVKGKFGSSGDLQIFHDGSNSYIKEVGTGTLRLQTNGAGIDFYKDSTEFLARLITDGAVELYYDSAKKFETVTGGVLVTGELEATTLDINGNADISGNLAVDGIANLDNTDIDGTFNATGTTFDVNSSTSLTLDNTNTTNGVKINTATSGSPVTIGHATSEVLIADNLTINGNLTTKGDVIIENTTNLAIRDTIITLNDGTSGTSGTDSSDIGIMMERHGTNKFFGYDASANEFIMVESTADVSGAVSGVQMGTTQTLAANIRAYDSIKIGETANDAVSVFPASTTTSLGTSNTLVPTQNAVKTYVDAKTWNGNDITAGTVVSARLDADTAHLSETQTFSGAKTFSAATSIGSAIASNKYSVVTVQGRESHMFAISGLADHTLTLNSGSYFQAEVIITAHQTNGGTYNNLYVRGIWSNNHTSHHWDEIENIGGLTNSTFTITNGQNGSTAASGQLAIVHDYVSASFSNMTVNVIKHFGALTHVIS